MSVAAHNGPLWAVTSYFNPAGFRRRRENYRVFRDRLAVPLAAVELSFNGHFELAPQDAEILIQIPGRDVMWQKERLLNVAVGNSDKRAMHQYVRDYFASRYEDGRKATGRYAVPRAPFLRGVAATALAIGVVS
jgi:hypothetical protein